VVDVAQTNKSAMEARLAVLREQEEAIERERVEIYRASIDATGDDKLCPDWMAEMLSEKHRVIEYPVQITGIARSADAVLEAEKNTKWVAVRSCDPAHGEKTYLGMMLGRMATAVGAQLSKDGVLEIGFGMHNPAMYVPELHEVVMGNGSWWSRIEKPEDLSKITNADINDIWYVRALRELEKG